MVTLEELRRRREEIMKIAATHGASHLRVFGSVARGDARSESDVDILIDIEDGRSLLDIIAMKQDLEDLLGCSVDVGLGRSLRSGLRDRVLREAVTL